MIAKDGYCSYSTNGINWTEYNTGCTKIIAICYGDANKRFIAIAVNIGSYGIYCNSSAIANKTTWSGQDFPSIIKVTDVCYGEGIYLAANNASGSYVQSTDGITWTDKTFNTSSGSGIHIACNKCVYLNDKNTGVSRFIFYNTNTNGYLISNSITTSLTWTSVDAPIKIVDGCNTDTNPMLIMNTSDSVTARIGTITINSTGPITYTTSSILYNGGENYSSFTSIAYGNNKLVLTNATDNDKPSCYLFAVYGAFPSEYNYVD